LFQIRVHQSVAAYSAAFSASVARLLHAPTATFQVTDFQSSSGGTKVYFNVVSVVWPDGLLSSGGFSVTGYSTATIVHMVHMGLSSANVGSGCAGIQLDNNANGNYQASAA